jgi:hypothetical protein
MDDQPNRTGNTGAEGPPAAGTADENLGWNADAGGSAGQSGTGAPAERMLAQLQTMIDQIATQAAPVVRQVGAKAAELAAAAAERAGPIAHKAADVTADASVKLAERSRELAADLRRELGSTESRPAAPGTEDVGGPTGTKDDPAEG